jgi:hypothetical protein
MYANMLVRVGDQTYVAHEVAIHGPHAVEIHLDDPNGESNYAEPVGITNVDPAATGPIRITANF